MSREVTYSSINGNRPSNSTDGTPIATSSSKRAIHITNPVITQDHTPPKATQPKVVQPKTTQPNSSNTNSPSSQPPRNVPPKDGQKSGYDKYLLYKKLPYVKRRMDFGTWIYRNRWGVSVTVIVYLTAMFFVSTMRFEITSTEFMQGFFVELPPEEKEPEPKPEEPKPKEPEIIEQEMMKDVKNVAVNENAKLDGGLKDDRGTKASDIYKDAQAMQDKLNASHDAHSKATAEDEAYLNDLRQSLQQKGQNDKVREDTKVTGNVTISWKLDGRSAVYIHNPAYRCKGAGTVTVNITVNRNGAVIAASVDKISRAGDNCLIDMAIEAAEKTTFNVSASAPEKQTGSITYIFMAQ